MDSLLGSMCKLDLSPSSSVPSRKRRQKRERAPLPSGSAAKPAPTLARHDKRSVTTELNKKRKKLLQNRLARLKAKEIVPQAMSFSEFIHWIVHEQRLPKFAPLNMLVSAAMTSFPTCAGAVDSAAEAGVEVYFEWELEDGKTGSSALCNEDGAMSDKVPGGLTVLRVSE